MDSKANDKQFALVCFEEEGHPLDVIPLKNVLDLVDLEDTTLSRRIIWKSSTSTKSTGANVKPSSSSFRGRLLMTHVNKAPLLTAMNSIIQENRSKDLENDIGLVEKPEHLEAVATELVSKESRKLQSVENTFSRSILEREKKVSKKSRKLESVENTVSRNILERARKKKHADYLEISDSSSNDTTYGQSKEQLSSKVLLLKRENSDLKRENAQLKRQLLYSEDIATAVTELKDAIEDIKVLTTQPTCELRMLIKEIKECATRKNSNPTPADKSSNVSLGTENELATQVGRKSTTGMCEPESRPNMSFPSEPQNRPGMSTQPEPQSRPGMSTQPELQSHESSAAAVNICTSEKVLLHNGVYIDKTALQRCLLGGTNENKLARNLLTAFFSKSTLANSCVMGKKSNVTGLQRNSLPEDITQAVIGYTMKKYPTAKRSNVILAMNSKCKESRRQQQPKNSK